MHLNTMTVYNLYIFGKNGDLLHYSEWNRKRRTDMKWEQEVKLMYGSLFSLKNFCRRMSPVDFKDGFMNYSTSSYMLSVLETVTGFKFVMNTDLHCTGVKALLERIYSQIFVEYAVKSPLWSVGQPIESDLFKSKLDEAVTQFASAFPPRNI